LRRKLFTLPRSESVARSTACEVSLSCAAIATGLAALDCAIRADKFTAKAWPDDRDVLLILRGTVSPTTRDDAAALGTISTAFLSALVPRSAAADLFNRALALQFGAGSVPKLEPE
jgi:hypothetical protein